MPEALRDLYQVCLSISRAERGEELWGDLDEILDAIAGGEYGTSVAEICAQRVESTPTNTTAGLAKI